MSRPLHATLTRCAQGNPLITLDSEPYNGMEIRPGELKRLTQHLSALAEMANRLPVGGKNYRPTRVLFDGEKPWSAIQPSDSTTCTPVTPCRSRK